MAREKKQELFKFPMQGINVVRMKNEQPEGTCIDCENVRPFDQIEDRARGGSRPGLTKHSSARGSANRIQDLNYVTTISTSLAVGSMSRRTITPVQVNNGVIAWFDSSSVNNATVAGTQALGDATETPFCFSAELFGKLYFADGFGYKVYTHSNTTAHDWTPTAGSLPGDQGNNITCRLIEAWRGRIVLSGLASDPYNWFMSKLGNPLDFDYAPTVETELDAVQGGNGFIGKVPDVINCIIPYNDDVLLFGCDHSIWMMSGDPQSGGRLDLVTDTVGIAFGRPWTQLPDGTLMFFSNSGSVYRMAPGGGKPKNITEENIDPLITPTNLNTHIVRMAYDEQAEGVHMFITPLTTGVATHWFYDIRHDGWFKVTYPDNNFNPVSLLIFDGDSPGDRVMMLGGEDGYVRRYSSAVARDDGTVFTSFAILGPIVAEKGRYPTILSDVQFIMDDTSGNVIYEIGVGDTAESAIADFAATFTGEVDTANTTIDISAGKSKNINPRTRGYFQYFKVGTKTPGASTSWAIEYIQASWQVITSSKGRAILTDTISFVDPDLPSLLPTTDLWAYYTLQAPSTITLADSNTNLSDWSPYQKGSGVNTIVLSNTGADGGTKASYTASDSNLNDKPAAFFGTGGGRLTQNTAVLDLDTATGFLTMVAYSNTLGNGMVWDFLRTGSTEDIEFHLKLNTTLWMQIDGDVGSANPQPLNRAGAGIGANTAAVWTFGRRATGGWQMRQNGVTLNTANLSDWWSTVDTGTGLRINLGVANKVWIGAFAIYSDWVDSNVSSVENTLAANFGITI